jgi:hypothetical protein
MNKAVIQEGNNTAEPKDDSDDTDTSYPEHPLQAAQKQYRKQFLFIPIYIVIGKAEKL